MTHTQYQRRAITIFEVLIVVIVIMVLVAIILVLAPGGRRDGGSAKRLKDAAQIREIHKAWTIYSRESKGVFPLPGEVMRGPDPTLGILVPGRGPEREELNNHANLYSLCIMQNYFSPAICISATELSNMVTSTIGANGSYDWDTYDPAGGVYFDGRMKARLDTGSNISFVQMPLSGERRKIQWRASGDSTWAMVGNRGPEGFADEAAMEASMKQSLTTQFHGNGETWEGAVCFNDGHVQVSVGIWPYKLTHECPGAPGTPDNLFHNACGTGNQWGDGGDNYLCLVYELTPGKPDHLGVTWD